MPSRDTLHFGLEQPSGRWTISVVLDQDIKSVVRLRALEAWRTMSSVVDDAIERHVDELTAGTTEPLTGVPTVNSSFSVRPDTHSRLLRAKQETGLSVSAIVGACLARHFGAH